MNKDFYSAIKARRSRYSINKEVKISDEKIEEIIKEAITHTPTAFNSQSGRAVLLLEENHDKLWNITEDNLREVVSGDFSDTEEKIQSFRNGYGTVLFFEDQNAVKSLQEKFPLYKDNFPMWSQQSSGMLQFIVWTSFDIEGLGATVQHYNELIEKDIKEEFDLPDNWKLISQMPFGNPTEEPGDKDYLPLEERFKVFK